MRYKLTCHHIYVFIGQKNKMWVRKMKIFFKINLFEIWIHHDEFNYHYSFEHFKEYELTHVFFSKIWKIIITEV